MYKFNFMFRNLWCQIVLAIFTTMAFFNNKRLPVYEEMVKSSGTENQIGIFFAKLNFVLNGYNLLSLLIVICLVYMYKKFYSQGLRFDKTAAIVAGLFAIIMLLGDSFKIVGSWDLVFKDGFQLFISAIYFIGYTVLFYVGISWLFIWLDKYQFKKNEEIVCRVTDFIFNKHLFICAWLILWFSWLPYLVAFYPGTVNYDSFYQLQQFFGERSLSNSHPIFSTFIMGNCFNIGQAFGGDNLGIFVYVLLQSIVFSASLAFAISQMRNFNMPVVVKKISLLFFAIYPMFPGYAQYMVKDTLYISFFVFYLVLFVMFIQKPYLWYEFRYKISFFVLIMLICLIRHNGIHITIISGVAFLFLKIEKKIKLQYGTMLLLIYILFYIYSNVIISSFGIINNVSTGSALLSIPLQQTARYIKYHDEEVTPEEKHILSKVLQYDVIAERYNPEIADYVTSRYRVSEKKDFNEYMIVWFKQFIKHPGTYIQAFIHKIYGYFYTDIGVWGYLGFNTSMEMNPYVNSGFINVNMIEKWQPFRNFIINYADSLRRIPGLGLLYSIGMYTWILILMLAYLIRTKHFQPIVAYMPAILTLLICIVSPVNRYLRYYMPIIAFMPLLIAYFLYVIQQNSQNKHLKTNRKIRYELTTNNN